MLKETFVGYSDIPRFSPEVKEAHLGDAVTITSHPFGREITNADLLRLAIESGLPENEIEKSKNKIESTGFTSRYMHCLPGEACENWQETDRATSIGAYLLRRALAKHPGWGGDIDVMAVTSAFLPIDINQEILEKAHLDSSKIKTVSYRTACAGAINALTDVLADPNLRGARLAIVSLEPLSLIIGKEHMIDSEKMPIPAVFGDDFAVTLIDTAKFQLTGLKTVVLPDHGVIRVNKMYDFKSIPNEPWNIPGHYELKDGASDIFRYSNEGVFLDLFPPDDGKTTYMDGVGTGLHFGDNTSSQIAELLTETGQRNLFEVLGEENLIIHPASRPVVNRIAKKLTKAGLYNAKTLPFYMDAWRRSNSSSATTMVRWQKMIENGLINPQKPLLFVAPGVGSVIVTATANVKP